MEEFDAALARGEIIVVDTIAPLRPGQIGAGGTAASAADAGKVAIAASHAGHWTGYCAARVHVRGVIQNDAGIGKDNAGIASLPYLDALGVPAAAASHESCCIGDRNDLAEHGIVSFVNGQARKLGCAPGQSVKAAAVAMLAAQLHDYEIPPYSETRLLMHDVPDEPRVWAMDSLSLLLPEHDGAIVVTASHGALFNGSKEDDGFVRPGILAITVTDAGVGKNRAGISRLSALDSIGVAGAAVDVRTARIGNGRSVYEGGQISFVNSRAAALGAEPGISVQEYVQRMLLAFTKEGSQ